jgi:AcrR family transcriptional regulator
VLAAKADQQGRRSGIAQIRDRGAASRRRGEKLVDALLEAAWDEVSAVGYASLTIEGVAARAGTSKSVLYRRWPNRATLVRAAMRHHVGPFASDIPETGELRRDVLAVLCRYRDRYQEIGPDIVHGLMTEAPDLPREVFEVTPGVMMTVLTHAAQRGDVRLDTVTPRIAALPSDLVRHELLISGGRVPDAVLVEIIDDIFLPLVAGPGTPGSPPPKR